LLIATLAYYDDGSEALHATLYGCMLELGVFKPQKPPMSIQELVTRHHANLSTIFFAMTLVLNQLLSYISEKARLNELKKEADNMLKDLKKSMRQVLDSDNKK
jgi:hypothetical protein